VLETLKLPVALLVGTALLLVLGDPPHAFNKKIPPRIKLAPETLKNLL
jgi:hypothetical protein